MESGPLVDTGSEIPKRPFAGDSHLSAQVPGPKICAVSRTGHSAKPGRVTPNSTFDRGKFAGRQIATAALGDHKDQPGGSAQHHKVDQ